jgi:riboflavin kinase / FMN adenylyltransferase
MQLIRGLSNITPRHHGCVATIGNFDGVHLGHREIIKRLKRHAEALGVPSVVIIFEPQPAEFFQRGRIPVRLSLVREKFEMLRDNGVDRLLVLRFSPELSKYSAERFVNEILVERLGIKALIIGDDFRFGKGRDGDFNVLQELAQKSSFTIEQTPPFLFIGKRISSTYIRNLLRHGYLKEAERMLGHPYCLSGHVVHGHQNGRKWGFPTANLNLHRVKNPIVGIYAARVHGLSDTPLMGIAYAGTRPIIDDPRFVLEVHIFDFDQDCYGKRISVQFCSRIRGDMDFDSFEDMAEQIKRDCEAARESLTFEYRGS